jgi:hypothetical protein
MTGKGSFPRHCDADQLAGNPNQEQGIRDEISAEQPPWLGNQAM